MAESCNPAFHNMTSQTSSPTVQICRTCGGGAPVDVHFCPQCTKILTLGRQGDYFAFMGLPRRLNVPAAELEQNFRTLSRQFHPDYFYNAPPAERRASLERSSYLNDAYRTLKQPISRIGYLLELEGFGTAGTDQSQQVPPALLEEVFALNEELDEVRDWRANGAPVEQLRARIERARQPIEAKRTAHEDQLQQLAAQWDALMDGGANSDERREVLTTLRERMLERNYINNLLAGIERELSA
jgi:molecular chaperone HscB